MYHKKGNIIVDKSFSFACEIVLFCKELRKEHEFEIASQLIKCGTSIGANVRESQRGVSTKNFKNKLGIALKEAEETDYWLDIIEATTFKIPNNLQDKCQELIKLLVAIIKNS